MAQKNATPSKEQKESIIKSELNPLLWTVMKELKHALVIRHRLTGKVRVIDK